jgi:hypothetical protein
MFEQEKRVAPRAQVRWPVTMLTSQTKAEREIQNISSKGAFVSCKDLPPPEDDFIMINRAPDHQTTRPQNNES